MEISDINLSLDDLLKKSHALKSECGTLRSIPSPLWGTGGTRGWASNYRITGFPRNKIPDDLIGCVRAGPGSLLLGGPGTGLWRRPLSIAGTGGTAQRRYQTGGRVKIKQFIYLTTYGKIESIKGFPRWHQIPTNGSGRPNTISVLPYRSSPQNVILP